jgi:hypothetical protein
VEIFGIAEEERDDLIARLEALEAERLEAVQDVQLLRKAVLKINTGISLWQHLVS